MTPKSVGVPDSKLVLGKHSGRHALSMRCEQLGYQFDRRALDDIYRRFVRLADKIKHVEDHHLLELIRDTHKPTMSATPLIEPVIPATNAAVVSAPAEIANPFPPPEETNPFGVRVPARGEAHQDQTQQEDYLWGV
jgi:2-isopropylmalate synthase